MASPPSKLNDRGAINVATLADFRARPASLSHYCRSSSHSRCKGRIKLSHGQWGECRCKCHPSAAAIVAQAFVEAYLGTPQG